MQIQEAEMCRAAFCKGTFNLTGDIKCTSIHTARCHQGGAGSCGSSLSHREEKTFCRSENKCQAATADQPHGCLVSD